MSRRMAGRVTTIGVARPPWHNRYLCSAYGYRMYAGVSKGELAPLILNSHFNSCNSLLLKDFGPMFKISECFLIK